MTSFRWGTTALATVLCIGAVLTGCHPTFLVVPGAERDTVTDTIRVRDGRTHMPVRPVTRVDTVFRTDTVVRVDTVRAVGRTPIVRRDTVVRVDTVERVDTVRIRVDRTVVRVDTVRVPGKRLMLLPPGHYPPEGQCRVWIHGTPPGQQARATACTALRRIPDGAFILFGGEAWDFDYDWLAEAQRHPGAVPPEIIALKR